MNIQDAKAEIINTIKTYTAKNEWGLYKIPSLRQRPILLIGPPGIGKTAIMAQAAAQCQIGFVSYTMTHHTRQSAMGLPFIKQETFQGQEYAVTEYTMSEILASVYQTIEETGKKEGLLFLDEINCVSETLAPAMLQFLQNKTFGNHRLPEGWVLAAAGNPPEYNKSVREFDIATLDRMKYITIEADLIAWQSYAVSSGIHPAILSYLAIHPENFYQLQQTFSKQVFVTARGWEDLSCILLEYEAQSIPVTEHLILEYLHLEELSHDFCGYYHWYTRRNQCIPIPEMLGGDAQAFQTCCNLLAPPEKSADSVQLYQEQIQFVYGTLAYLQNQFSSYRNAQNLYKGLSALITSLKTFQGQQKISELSDAVSPFLLRESEVLRIRREHNLSTEDELRQTQLLLYYFQKLSYEYKAKNSETSGIVFQKYLDEQLQLQRKTIEQQAQTLNQQITNAIHLFQNPAISSVVTSAFTLFLSSIQKDAFVSSFLRQNPNEVYLQALSILDYDNNLRTLLTYTEL